jgi:threonine dehydrogenase-like Zn-dependent dehydrogenase
MRAVVARRDELMPTVTEVGRPEPDPGEALVRTLRVGIDGTDYEVLEGNHGSFPPDTAYRVMGHEAVGVVADPNDTSLDSDYCKSLPDRPHEGVRSYR